MTIFLNTQCPLPNKLREFFREFTNSTALKYLSTLDSTFDFGGKNEISHGGMLVIRQSTAPTPTFKVILFQIRCIKPFCASKKGYRLWDHVVQAKL